MFKGDIPEVGRFGHSANVYKKKIVIFGGETRYANTKFNIRECFNDVRIFCTETFEW